MERLHSIINSLKAGEIRLIRAFFRSQSAKGSLGKGEKLFTLILAKPNCTEKEALQNLFARKNRNAFKQIKKRLKMDILNLLLLQEAEMKFKSKYAQEVFNCRRYIIQGELLLGRGVYDEAIDVFLVNIAIRRQFFRVPERHLGSRRALDPKLRPAGDVLAQVEDKHARRRFRDRHRRDRLHDLDRQGLGREPPPGGLDYDRLFPVRLMEYRIKPAGNLTPGIVKLPVAQTVKYNGPLPGFPVAIGNQR